jgi:hypothetical protein
MLPVSPITSTESSSASAVAQKESALAYKITRISLGTVQLTTLRNLPGVQVQSQFDHSRLGSRLTVISLAMFIRFHTADSVAAGVAACRLMSSRYSYRQNKGVLEEGGGLIASFAERQRLVDKPRFDEMERRYAHAV